MGEVREGKKRGMASDLQLPCFIMCSRGSACLKAQETPAHQESMKGDKWRDVQSCGNVFQMFSGDRICTGLKG